MASGGWAASTSAKREGRLRTRDPWQSWIARASCLLALGLLAFYVVESWHWIVMWDGAVMHYVHFLITRGFRPYVDITDMNLPGCYLMEGWAMSVFGWGDLQWRLYEYFLYAVLLTSGVVIGGNRHWLAGVYVAVLFALMHGAEGPMMAVERDEVMTVLLLAAMAFFFLSLRRGRPLLLLPFGLLAGLATSLKPGAVLLDVSLIVLAVASTARRGERWLPYLFWALGGNLIVSVVTVGFVLRYHALHELIYIARNVLPYYVREKNQGAPYLLQHLFSAPLVPLPSLALLALLLQRRVLTWERVALWLGIGSGFASYWIQRKGYLYHRYMFTVFVLLWAGWELTGIEARHRWQARALEVTAFLLVFALASPLYAYELFEYPRVTPPPQNLALALEKDLQQLGGGSLQREVQCFDLVNGCLNALYRLRLVQNTGTTGDLLLFSPVPSPAVSYYRAWFAQRAQSPPPDVIVLGNEYYHQAATSFDKVTTWPQYAAYMRANYVKVIERHFGHDNEPAYQILLRKGSPVLVREMGHPLR